MAAVLNKNWEYKTLSQLGTIGRGKSKHRPRNDAILYGGKYPFIQTSDIKHSNFYVNSYSQTYNEVGLAQSKLWQKNTLCMTIAANIAETALLSFSACFPDSVVGFIVDPNKSDVKFIKYALDFAKREFQKTAKGTAQDNLSLEKIDNLRIKVPDVQTQSDIASVLFAYDDLIENNEKRIRALEEIAQSFYTEWFVKFKFSGHEKAKMLDSGAEYGMIPEGWEIKKFGEIIELAYGKALKEENRTEGNVLVYGSSGLVGTHNEKLVNGPGIVVGRKGNAGAVHWVDDDFYPIDTTYYIKSNLDLHFIYYLLKNHGFVMGDVAVPGLNRNQTYLSTVLLPPAPLITAFSARVKNIFNLVSSLSKKNLRLGKMRDLLIPQLVSGKRELKIS